MRGFVPLFLTFFLTSQVWSSPVHQSQSLFDGPSSNDAKSHREELEEFLEDRAQDRKKLFKKKDVKNEVQGTIPAPGELFEGDMIMDEQLRQAVLGEANKRSVTTNKDRRWKKGIVPYVFDPHIAHESKKCLQNAMAAFHKHTCIVFRKKTAADADYLYLTSKPNVCSSWVGRRGGKQVVHIGHGCTRLGTCEHELLHALGMVHEQSRSDRDEHVVIKWNNIKKAERNNFNKYSYNQVDDEGIPFNFGSVMMYPNHAFAIDPSYPTIVSKKDPALIFGQRKQFSTGDVAQVNRLYNCPKDKYTSDLVEMLSDERIEEALEFDDEKDFQPLAGM